MTQSLAFRFVASMHCIENMMHFLPYHQMQHSARIDLIFASAVLHLSNIYSSSMPLCEPALTVYVLCTLSRNYYTIAHSGHCSPNTCPSMLLLNIY